MRSDSKLDGIKHKQVIVTQACLRSRQRRANYTSMWVLLLFKFGVGGEWGGPPRLRKNVRTSGKILAMPLISPSAICVSAVNICIWSFLARFSMMQIIYKPDDLGYSQESNCPFVVKYAWPCWYLFVTAKISSGWQVEVWEQQSSSTHLSPPPSSFAMRYSVLLGISCTYVL